MHVVAIADVDPQDGSLPEKLADALDTTAFEARSRLGSAGPTIVAVVHGGPAEAEAIAAALRANGFTAMVRDTAALEREGLWLDVWSFELDAEAWRVRARGGEERVIPFGAVETIVRGMLIVDATTTKTEVSLKMAPGSRMLTMGPAGLLAPKTVKKEVTERADTRTGFLHVYSRGGPVCVVDEASVRFTGLGDAMEPTRAANLVRLTQLLRQRAPHALYDDRLNTQLGQRRTLLPPLDSAEHMRLASALIASWAAQRPRRPQG